MNGIIVINKQKDFTSFDVVAVARGILREKKIGHSGTLDPMATGVLPVLVGRTAKSQSLLPDTEKEYEADFRLGVTTDTLDVWGRVLSEKESSCTAEDIERVLPRFRGNIMQVPPMYSAIQKDGVRLYDLARQGIEVERQARPVCISTLELLGFDEKTQSGRLRISCSKGTYIRVICDDIGKALGCGCIMTALCRTRACGFTLADALTLRQLEAIKNEGRIDEVLRPADSIFSCFPAAYISEKQAVRFSNGGSLSLDRVKSVREPENSTLYRIYGGDVFLGLGQADTEKNELTVKKLFIDSPVRQKS